MKNRSVGVSCPTHLYTYLTLITAVTSTSIHQVSHVCSGGPCAAARQRTRCFLSRACKRTVAWLILCCLQDDIFCFTSLCFYFLILCSIIFFVLCVVLYNKIIKTITIHFCLISGQRIPHSVRGHNKNSTNVTNISRMWFSGVLVSLMDL